MSRLLFVASTLCLLGLLALPWPTLSWVSAQPPAARGEVDELIQQLFSQNPAVKSDAARRLRRFGAEAKPAVPALIELVSHEDVQVRAAALRTLGAIGSAAEEAIPAMLTRLNDRDPIDQGEVWLVAGEAIGKIGGEAALEAVMPLLVPGDQDARFRGACLVLHTMGESATPALPRLIELLEEGTEPLGPPLYAIEGIGSHGAEAVPAMIKLLDHENFHYQYFVCRVLAAMGETAEPAVPKLIDRLRDGAPSVRRHAALALGGIGPVGGEEAVKALTAALADPLAPVRQDAATALGQFGSTARSAAPALAEAAADTSFPARAQAAASLWKVDPSRKELVLKVLFDELQSIQAPWDAARELGRLAAEAEVEDRILGMLDTAPAEQKEQVVEAIGWMGAAGRPALDKLKSIQEDETAEPDLREAAREAIQRIEAESNQP